MARQAHLYLLALFTLLVGCIDDRKSAADDDTVDQDIVSDAGTDSAVPPPPPAADMGAAADAAQLTCEDASDCPPGSECINGACTAPECRGDDDCTAFVQGCIEGACRDRCLGDRCLRGGICTDGFCLPPECEGDSDCSDDQRCREGVCEEWTACEDDTNCGADERCVEGACEALPDCVGDRGCDPGTICDDGRCRPQPACDEERPCAEGTDCVGERCVPFVCRGDIDCEGDTECRAGVCVAVEPPEVAAVIILTRPQTVVAGTVIGLRAVGLSLRGDIVASEGFTWSSSDEAVISTNNDDNSAAFNLGAMGSATATVTASFENPDGTTVTSSPVSFRVVEANQQEGLTVSVVDAATGRAIGGATVQIGQATFVTDETGTTQVDVEQGPVTVSGFAGDYDYLTLVGVEVEEDGSHLLLPLWPRTSSDRVAGFTGAVDYDRVTTEGGVELGLTGPSFGGGLTNITFDNLLGQTFNREINAGPANIDLPLPGGLTLTAEIPFLGRIDAKSTYYVTSEPGLRLGWSFGGRIDVDSVIALAQGGGGDGIGQVLGVLLPYFETFNHGLRVGERLVELPTVVDQDDLDGDGDDMEQIPDYDRFPVLNIGPDQQQRVRMQIDATELLGQGETAILFPGVQFQGIGFVPLGVTAATEPGEIPARMAAPYGGLEGGDVTVLAISAAFGDARDLPRDITLRIKRYGLGVPRLIQFPDNDLLRPEAAEWNPVLREFGGVGSERAQAHRVVFSGPEGRWHVYFAPGAAPELTLPVPPEGAGDLSAGSLVRFEALRFGDADDPAWPSFRDLIEIRTPFDLSQIDRYTTTVARKSL